MKSLQTPLDQLGLWHSRHSRATIALLFLLAVSSLSAGPFVWETKTPNSLVRFEAVGGAAGSKLYQFSGFYTLGPKILATTHSDIDKLAGFLTRSPLLSSSCACH